MILIPLLPVHILLPTKKPGILHRALERITLHSTFSDISFLSLDLFILHSPSALLSRFRSYFDLNRFDSPLFFACSHSTPRQLGVQLYTELVILWCHFSFRICVPVLRDNRSCGLETLLILRLIFTSSPFGSSLTS
jgi:hypothetical protein